MRRGADFLALSRFTRAGGRLPPWPTGHDAPTRPLGTDPENFYGDPLHEGSQNPTEVEKWVICRPEMSARDLEWTGGANDVRAVQGGFRAM